jgi:hypothetical protein
LFEERVFRRATTSAPSWPVAQAGGRLTAIRHLASDGQRGADDPERVGAAREQLGR